MEELVYTLNIKDKEALGNIRCIPGIKAAVNEDFIWLRGVYDGPAMDIKIKQLPAKQIFYLDEKDLLFETGAITPVAELPSLDWKPLPDFLPVEMPVAALPGQTGQKVSVKLVPTGKAKRGDALLTSLQTLNSYADAAPAIRLSALKFAVNENNEVLVIGDPLPPLPGKEYWLNDNMLLPNGYELEIPMMADFINAGFNANQGSILLFDIDGSWQLIAQELFVPAKRSAIRLTSGNKISANLT